MGLSGDRLSREGQDFAVAMDGLSRSEWWGCRRGTGGGLSSARSGEGVFLTLASLRGTGGGMLPALSNLSRSPLLGGRGGGDMGSEFCLLCRDEPRLEPPHDGNAKGGALLSWGGVSEWGAPPL